MIVPTTPEPNIIEIAFALNFLRINNAPINNPASTYLKLEKTIWFLSALNKPSKRIDKPADAISETTAGRRAARTVCTPPKLLYL